MTAQLSPFCEIGVICRPPREVVTAVTAGVTSHWNGDYLYESENRSGGRGRCVKVVLTVRVQA